MCKNSTPTILIINKNYDKILNKFYIKDKLLVKQHTKQIMK